MQHRYAGDVGDFVKFAVLRALSANDCRIGVLWWLHPDESHNDDGKHCKYLSQPERWRHLDASLFDSLARLNRSTVRSVHALEQAGLLNGEYFSEPVPWESKPSERAATRVRWLASGMDRLRECDILFLDPDNGLASSCVRPTQKRAGKSVLMEDLQRLGSRSLVVYHHQSRFSGGHEMEFRALADRLKAEGFRVNGALRAKPWSPRLFILVGCEEGICKRARDFANRWGDAMQWLTAN